MMEQKTFLAVALSFGVLLIWSTLFPPPPPQTKLHTSSEPLSEAVSSSSPSTSLNLQRNTPQPAAAIDLEALKASSESYPAKEVVVETPLYRATFDSQGGIITSFQLKQFNHTKPKISITEWLPFLEVIVGKPEKIIPTQDNLVEMIQQDHLPGIRTLGLEFEGNDALTQAFHHLHFDIDHDSLLVDEESQRQTLTLRSPVHEGIQVVKQLVFDHESYIIDYKVTLVNHNENSVSLKARQVFGQGRIPDSKYQGGYGHLGAVYHYDGNIETEDAEDLVQEVRVSGADWIAIEDLYFITAARSLDQTQGFFKSRPKLGEEGSYEPFFGSPLPGRELGSAQQVPHDFKLYLGPKDDNQMVKFGRKLELSHDMTLDFIAKPLLALLLSIYSYVGNYGVAIIILTIIVRIVLFPLAVKSMRSMKRMQQLQPKMKKLQEKHKNDRQRLNQEIMALYQKNKVNPMGGCLPIVLQIPIFFGLYSALSLAVELRHAPFYGWITDLSAPDGLGITPILMGLSMYILQKLTPNTIMDPMQMKIMNMLPVIFTLFTFSFPAGLTVYWTTSNILSIGQQYLIHRMKTPELIEEPAPKGKKKKS